MRNVSRSARFVLEIGEGGQFKVNSTLQSNAAFLVVLRTRSLNSVERKDPFLFSYVTASIVLPTEQGGVDFVSLRVATSACCNSFTPLSLRYGKESGISGRRDCSPQLLLGEACTIIDINVRAHFVRPYNSKRKKIIPNATKDTRTPMNASHGHKIGKLSAAKSNDENHRDNELTVRVSGAAYDTNKR